MTGNITATANNVATQVVFKNCAPFEKCRTEINEIFADETDFINITMPMDKYLSNFWRLLEMPLINCKVELSLK